MKITVLVPPKHQEACHLNMKQYERAIATIPIVYNGRLYREIQYKGKFHGVERHSLKGLLYVAEDGSRLDATELSAMRSVTSRLAQVVNPETDGALLQHPASAVIEGLKRQSRLVVQATKMLSKLHTDFQKIQVLCLKLLENDMYKTHEWCHYAEMLTEHVKSTQSINALWLLHLKEPQHLRSSAVIARDIVLQIQELEPVVIPLIKHADTFLAGVLKPSISLFHSFLKEYPPSVILDYQITSVEYRESICRNT